MHQGDYGSAPYNYQYPLPNLQNLSLGGSGGGAAPVDHNANPYAAASAPPLSSSFSPSDYSSYPHSYPPYQQNPDPIPPPTAPSFAPNPNPNLQTSFNPPPQPTPPLPSPPHSSSFNSYDLHGQYQSTAPQQPRQQPGYPSFDQHQPASNYGSTPAASVPPPNPSPNPNASYSSMYSSAPYAPVGSSVPPLYDMPPYENSPKFDHGSSYFNDRYDGYSRNRSDYSSDLYGKRPETNAPSQYDLSRDYGYSDGAYAYTGKVEPYGARGTVPKSSSSTLFDDYGRPISASSTKDPPKSSAKIVRAIPKADTQEDVKSGVQKFRVKLLPESGSQSSMDVLCQIGLDGIRMLDPNTSRTLRIYPLENITRCEVADSSTFAFWSKSSVDIEPRRIRLQSNRYTTNTLLDTVTAATVQLKEMGGGRSKPADTVKTNEQPTEKKKGFADWVNFIKPPNEEKDHWVPDEAVSKCTACGTDFGAFVRRHHCRNCGDIFCDKCTSGRIALTAEENAQPVRVCDRCMAEVTQRLTNAKEAASRAASFHSHEDLARKLQEEMEKNRRASSGSKSDGSGRRMKEVACPICTVHLQVQVPTSGSETIECGVCQHPFLVSAH